MATITVAALGASLIPGNSVRITGFPTASDDKLEAFSIYPHMTVSVGEGYLQIADDQGITIWLIRTADVPSFTAINGSAVAYTTVLQLFQGIQAVLS